MKSGKKISALAILVILFLPAMALASDLNPERIFEYVNLEREKTGAAPLKRNKRLDMAARAKADNLLQYQYFAHTAPNGRLFTSWIQEARYPYTACGENLAIDFTSERDVIDGWLKSPAHSSNMLDPIWQDSGIAVKTGLMNLRLSAAVVQLFGTTLPMSRDTRPTLESKKVAGAFKTNSNLQSQTTLLMTFMTALLLVLIIGIIAHLHVHPHLIHRD